VPGECLRCTDAPYQGLRRRVRINRPTVPSCLSRTLASWSPPVAFWILRRGSR